MPPSHFPPLMKTPALPRLCLLLLFLTAALGLRANDEAVIAAVRAADDERVAATMAADFARMDAVYSDQLHYTHSNGKLDNKKSYLDSIVTRRTVYSGYDYLQRDFHVATPEVVVMTAHVLITAGNGTVQNKNDLNVMAVWRLEAGKWRFHSWLSSKIPAPAAK